MDGGCVMQNRCEIFNETEDVLNQEIETLKKLLSFACQKESVKNAEFNIILVSKEVIHQMNRDYRGVDRVTDVISFALEDNQTIELEVRLLGDIYICVDRAREQAVEYKHSFLRELAFLSVHGFLHLLGYDHMNEEEEKIMFAKQEEILNEFGIKRESVYEKEEK